MIDGQRKKAEVKLVEFSWIELRIIAKAALSHRRVLLGSMRKKSEG